MTKRHKVGIGALGAIPVIVGAWIQVDNHLLERKRAVLQMQVEAEMQACEDDGGKWYRGECETESSP